MNCSSRRFHGILPIFKLRTNPTVMRRPCRSIVACRAHVIRQKLQDLKYECTIFGEGQKHNWYSASATATLSHNRGREMWPLGAIFRVCYCFDHTTHFPAAEYGGRQIYGDGSGRRKSMDWKQSQLLLLHENLTIC